MYSDVVNWPQEQKTYSKTFQTLSEIKKKQGIEHLIKDILDYTEELVLPWE
jgi:hypothetical protein